MLILWCSCVMHTFTVACCKYSDNDDVVHVQAEQCLCKM